MGEKNKCLRFLIAVNENLLTFFADILWITRNRC